MVAEPLPAEDLYRVEFHKAFRPLRRRGPAGS
jgi:hypothetical protein